MTPSEAIQRAKVLAIELFADDAASMPQLEAIEPSGEAAWAVTLSFRRRTPLAAGAIGISMDPSLSNYRKTIRLSDAGELISITAPDR